MQEEAVSVLPALSSHCPFFRGVYSGICVSQGGTYIPSVAERKRFCLTTNFKCCHLYSPWGMKSIRVMCHDDSCCVVDISALDELISEGKIKGFYRSDRWVILGCDPIRTGERPYEGPERRKATGRR